MIVLLWLPFLFWLRVSLQRIMKKRSIEKTKSACLSKQQAKDFFPQYLCQLKTNRQDIDIIPMAVRRSFSPTLKKSTDYNYRLQSTPPLSFQQYARSITPYPGAPRWQASGIYRPPSYHAYLSPAMRRKPEIPAVQPWIYAYRRKYSIPTYSLKNYKDIKPKSAEPIWHPPGRYVAKRQAAFSPEKRPEKPAREPVWQPPGKPQHKPVPYFDPPNLRWSLQELLKSTPDLRTKPLRVSRSVSVMRNQSIKD